jgi:hypothetical protein
MEVGPFRMVAASQTESGKVEARLVEGGWEEFATIVFSKSNQEDRQRGADGQSISLLGLDIRSSRLMDISTSWIR